MTLRAKCCWAGMGLFAVVGAVLLLFLSYPELPGGYRVRDLIEAPESRSASAFTRRWHARLRGFNAKATPEGENLVVLIGSSTLEGFPSSELLENPASIVNRAIGGEDLFHLLLRLDRDLPRSAGAWLLYLGAVDHHRDHRSPREIVGDARQVLGRLRHRAKTPIICIGVLPRRDPSPEESAGLEELHRLLGVACAELSATFISPLNTRLSSPQGLPSALSRDDFHLNQAGYRVLLDLLRARSETLFKLLR